MTLPHEDEVISDSHEILDIIDSIKNELSDMNYLQICNLLNKIVTNHQENQERQARQAFVNHSIGSYLYCSICLRCVTVESIGRNEIVTCSCGTIYRFIPSSPDTISQVPQVPQSQLPTDNISLFSYLPYQVPRPQSYQVPRPQVPQVTQSYQVPQVPHPQSYQVHRPQVPQVTQLFEDSQASQASQAYQARQRAKLVYDPLKCNVVKLNRLGICFSTGRLVDGGKCGVHRKDKFVRLSQEEFNNNANHFI